MWPLVGFLLLMVGLLCVAVLLLGAGLLYLADSRARRGDGASGPVEGGTVPPPPPLGPAGDAGDDGLVGRTRGLEPEGPRPAPAVAAGADAVDQGLVELEELGDALLPLGVPPDGWADAGGVPLSGMADARGDGLGAVPGLEGTELLDIYRSRLAAAEAMQDELLAALRARGEAGGRDGDDAMDVERVNTTGR